MQTEFKHGPFTFVAGCIITINGTPSRKWEMHYGSRVLGEKTISSPNVVLSEIYEAFGATRSEFEQQAKREHGPDQIHLFDRDSDSVLASFESYSSCGMTPGLMNNTSQLWLRSSDGRRTREVTFDEYAMIVAKNEAPENAWVTGLLPDDILSRDPDTWRPPTSWEIRHVVGEGSFTGVPGARAAAMVGVLPASFRKYTARDDSATRQKISFAMWHLLLHKLGVQSV